MENIVILVAVLAGILLAFFTFKKIAKFILIALGVGIFFLILYIL